MYEYEYIISYKLHISMEPVNNCNQNTDNENFYHS